jgi:hypothetical protein
VANSLNITNIPAPRAPFIDERTGLMAREWYRFFLNLFVLTGSGNNPITLEELQLGPPSQPDLAELLIQVNQNIAPQYEDQSGDFLATLDTAQLMSMMARFENAEAAIQGAYLQPPQLPVDGVYVVGPGSSTDNAVARFDGTTGKLIQNSVTTIDGTGNASGILSQQFSDGTAVTLAAGKMWYDGTTGAWNAGMGNGNITQQIGEEIFVYGKASAAITDSPLQIIYHTGVVGASGVITFAPTIAGITDVNAIIGVATESLALNGFGRATVFGVVRGITTNGTAFGEVWADDDVIWYNPVTGNPTKVEPVAPYIKVQVGLVIKAGAGGSGSFQVGIARGSKLGGTDSNVQFGTLANNNLIAYDSTAGYWKNVTASSIGLGTVSSVSVVSANGLAGTVATATTTPAITLSTTVTGLLKGNGTAISAATSGTDYAPATSGTSILYGNGSGGFNNVTIGTGVAFTAGTLSATGSGGTVTSVTGTAPVVSSGGTTPAISMAAATTSVNGYLTSTDWMTFNSKQAALVSGTNIKTVNGTTLLGSGDLGTITYAYGGTGQTTVTTGDLLYGSASNVWSKLGIGTTGQILRVVSGAPAWETDYTGTVTSVAALTLGTTGTDLSSTVANGTTTPVITLNVPTASASNRGALSAADWTTFNNKGSGTVTSVSGTAGRVSSTGGTTPVIDLVSGIASAGTTGSASLIPVVTIDTYGRVTSITTAANPQGTVTSVTGTAPVVSSGGATPAISMAAANTTTNGYLTSTDWATFNGKAPAITYTTNYIPYGQGTTTPTQSSSLTFDGTSLTVNTIKIGLGAGSVASNTAVGLNTLIANTTGPQACAFGNGALYSNQTGQWNNAYGYVSLFSNVSGDYNCAFGRAALYASTGSRNCAFGQGSLTSTTGNQNQAFGDNSGAGITTGGQNVILGSYQGGTAPISATGSNFVVLSDGAGNIVASTKNAQTFALPGGTLSSGTGIAFPATQSASSDANTLDDYEEGTWTPNQGVGLTVVGTFSSSGSYVKVGKMVTITGTVASSVSIAISAGGTICTNVPFTGSGNYAGSLFDSGTGMTGTQVWQQTNTVYTIAAMAASTSHTFTVTYFV